MPEPTEAGDKPFNAAAKDATRAAATAPTPGEPADGTQPNADAFKAMGLEPPKPAPSSTPAGTPPPGTPPPPAKTPEQLKAETEGKAVVDLYSGQIQVHAEELYTTLAARARYEEGFIDTLVSSKDPTDQKMAKKILERNADHFGAKTVDEYLANKAVAAAGDDPVQQELARLRLQQSQTDSTVKEQQWAAWKTQKGIEEGSELDKAVDSVRSEYPAGTPFADLIHVARGRLGITTPPPSTKSGAGVPPSGGGGPAEPRLPGNDVMNLMKIDQKVVSGAEEYFRQFD